MSSYGVVDVHYPPDGGARAALVTCADRRFAEITAENLAWISRVAPYQAGQFFLRELPAIRTVVEAAGPLELLVVDGYVDLEPGGRPGLGAHCHAEFGLPVLGVAKNPYHAATHAAQVVRGGSAKPLYVTATGLPLSEAATLVAEMSGPYRLPDVIRRVDALARGRA